MWHYSFVKTLKLTVIAILLFLNTACADNNAKYNYVNYQDLFEPKISVNLASSVFNRFEISFASRFAVVNDYLIVADSKADELIKVIDNQTGELLKSFGGQGQGPMEFISIFQILPDSNEENKFYIIDMSARNLKWFDLHRILNDDFHPEQIFSLASGFDGIPINFNITREKEFPAVGLFHDCRLSVLSLPDGPMRKIGKHPLRVQKDQVLAPQHAHGFIGNVAFKNKTREAYIATRHGSIVEKYNIDSGTMTTLIGPDSFFPDYDIVPAGQYHTMTYNKKTRYGYLDVCYNEHRDRLFLLYSGKMRYGERNERPYLGSTVYVLDGRDTIVEKFRLDTEIGAIGISKDGSVLYGLTETDVIKFQL